MKRFFYYFRVWKIMAKNALLNWSVNRKVLMIFLLGKIIRYVTYFGFLYLLVSAVDGLAGYNQNQALFFTATYILIDTVAQFFFRNVYNFRTLVVTGDFDLVLAKPMSALFRSLMGGPDPIDLITIPPIIALVVYIGFLLHPSLLHIFYYVLLLINGLLVASALHIFVLAFGIIVIEIDHMIMVYRDLNSMGRFPIEIYKQPLQGILTFIVPVGLMVSFPAKALAGLLSLTGVIMAMALGVGIFYLSLRFWNFALTKYTSASS